VAGKYHLDPNLIWAIMKAESSFLEKAVSPAGAVGIMQLLPVTGHKIAKEMGFYPPDLTNPKVAIYAGGDLIATLSRKFGNNLVWVAAAYNAGILKAYEWKRKTHGLPLDLSVEQISFGETKRYVFRILNNYIVYSGIYEE
jgi:soluble lytic murein transglycosylase